MLLRIPAYTPFPFVFLATVLAACSNGDNAIEQVDASIDAADTPREASIDAPGCAYGQIICEGLTPKTCDGRGGFLTTDSAASCETECKDGLGCVSCEPGSASCASGVAKQCVTTGGEAHETTFSCSGPGTRCDEDGCNGPCSPAALRKTHEGCEFWPTVTANNVSSSPPDVFHFGVLLGNPSKTTSVNVTVKGVGLQPVETTLLLLPLQVQAIALPFVPELKGPDWRQAYVAVKPPQSVNKLNGAYRVQSDAPIIAYQFNSLEPQPTDTATSAGCVGLNGTSTVEGSCYAFSVDASLLLPSHVLTSNYFVASYQAWQQSAFRGDAGAIRIGDFLAITAIEDNTILNLTFPKTAPVLPWADPAPSMITMSAGQVVQLFTEAVSSEDSFSGTRIDSNRRVQVVTGHSCAAVPEDKAACSHMEDVVLPLEVLGTRYVLMPLGEPANRTPYSARILATANGSKDLDGSSRGTSVSFDPPIIPPATIGEGMFIDLDSLVEPVVIHASQPVAVVQYANSREGVGNSADPTRMGGPNQLFVVPTTRYLMSHTFAASPKFRTTYVQIVAETGVTVKLDDADVPADKFVAIGSTGLSYTVRTLTSSNEAVHTIWSDKPCGVVVQGMGPYSSYLYAAGLNVGTP